MHPLCDRINVLSVTSVETTVGENKNHFLLSFLHAFLRGSGAKVVEAILFGSGCAGLRIVHTESFRSDDDHPKRVPPSSPKGIHLTSAPILSKRNRTARALSLVIPGFIPESSP